MHESYTERVLNLQMELRAAEVQAQGAGYVEELVNYYTTRERRTMKCVQVHRRVYARLYICARKYVCVCV